MSIHSEYPQPTDHVIDTGGIIYPCKHCKHDLSIRSTTYGVGMNDSGYKVAVCEGCGYISPVDTNIANIVR